MRNLITSFKNSKDRKMAISIGIIVVLVLFLVFYDKDKKSGDIPGIKSFDNAEEIIIAKKDSQIKLYKKENKWVLNEQAYPADKAKAEQLEKSMKELEITDLITKDPYLTKYELDPEKAVRVTVKEKDKILRDVLIGKASSTYRSAYIKFADDNNVYLASGNLSVELNINLEDLRDKEIYKFGKDDVAYFELMYGGRLSFEKQTEEVEDTTDAKEAKENQDTPKEIKKIKVDKWICKEYRNTALDKSKVDSFLMSFSSINADTYPDMDKKDIKGLVCAIKSKVFGKDIVLNIHKKEKENYLCTSSESPYVFALREESVKKFFKSIVDFKQDAAPAQPLKK